MKTLKIALLGATALVGAGAFSAANAADVYAPRGSSLKDEPVYAPMVNWGGFYIGANAGGAFHTDDDASYKYTVNGVTKTGTIDGDRSGWLAGIHGGYNWQRSDFVFGIEGDIDAGDGIDYLGSVRGRLGVAFKHTLFYATGGVAFAGFGDDEIFDDDTQTGWVAGLGVEEKLTRNISVGLEGMRYSFSDVDKLCCDDVKYDQDFWVARARVTYHFGSSHESLK